MSLGAKMLKERIVKDAALVGVALALAFVFVQAFAPSAFAVDACTSNRQYDALNSLASHFVETFSHAAIGHLGEGTGRFSADPSWENLPGVLSDVLTVGAVLSATASALPSLNGSAAAAAAPNRGAGALDDLATTPLNRNITGVADDALVHFSPEGYSVIKPGVGGETFTFRYGDIKHLTPKQIETVIGPLSRGGQTGGTRVMHVLEDAISGATRTPGAVVSEIPEYILTKPSTVSGGFVVQ